MPSFDTPMQNEMTTCVWRQYIAFGRDALHLEYPPKPSLVSTVQHTYTYHSLEGLGRALLTEVDAHKIAQSLLLSVGTRVQKTVRCFAIS